jgi:DNA repair protein RadC
MLPLVPVAFLALAAAVDQFFPMEPSVPPAPTPLDRALAASAGESFGATQRTSAANLLAAEVLRVDLVEVPDTTLLAVLLAGATGTRDPREVAGEMLRASRGDLSTLSRGDILQAADLAPIGDARLLVVREIARRAAMRQAIQDHPEVTTAAGAAALFRSIVGTEDEHVAVLFLDSKLRLIRMSRLTTGTQGYSILDPKQILSEALRVRAAALMVAHNHPSGALEVSLEDQRSTRALVAAATVVGIQIIDHLILTRTGHLSMAEKGMMNRF